MLNFMFVALNSVLKYLRLNNDVMLLKTNFYEIRCIMMRVELFVFLKKVLLVLSEFL